MKIEIELHGQETPEILDVENYDVKEVYEILNGIKKNDVGNVYSSVILGDNIYSCVSIKTIKVNY